MRPEWVLADAHAGADPEADRGLLELLDRAAQTPIDLLMLGDLFTAWLALPRFLTDLQREIVERFARLRSAGGKVRFVVGNRDYLVREGQLGVAFDEVLEGEVRIDLGGVPTLVCHGDRLNPRDRGYAWWHALSRQRAVLSTVARLPPSLAGALATSLEARLRSASKRYKQGDLPFDGLFALGRRAAAEGASRALVGHFHHDRLLDVPGAVPVVLAPSWLDQRRILAVEPGGRLVSLDPLA